MTLDEALVKIVELESKITTLEEQATANSETISTKEEELRISKEANMTLFLKLTEKQKKDTSIIDKKVDQEKDKDKDQEAKTVEWDEFLEDVEF